MVETLKILETRLVAQKIRVEGGGGGGDGARSAAEQAAAGQRAHSR